MPCLLGNKDHWKPPEQPILVVAPQGVTVFYEELLKTLTH